MGKLRDTKLSGIVSVLNTPFGYDGKPDLDGLARHVEYAIEAGVNGFLLPAMASEVEYLTRNERKVMVATVIDEVLMLITEIGL
jgi:dihydrodipicolinate synthase/N-acetylneuraminate lyase